FAVNFANFIFTWIRKPDIARLIRFDVVGVSHFLEPGEFLSLGIKFREGNSAGPRISLGIQTNCVLLTAECDSLFPREIFVLEFGYFLSCGVPSTQFI